MVNQSDPFFEVKKALDLNVKLVEEITSLNLDKLHEDARDMLLSQTRQTVGKLGRILVQYNK